METKICDKCNKEKSIDDFSKTYYDGKHCGYRRKCKECKKEEYRIYKENNKEKIKESRKKYAENNQEKLKLRRQLYFLEHIDEISEKKKQYYIEHREEILEHNTEYRRNNPEHVNSLRKISRCKNSEKRKIALLKHTYNLTVEQYQNMLSKQNNVCAICGCPEKNINYKTKRVNSLSVDHNHETGKIRGLLCTRCNTVIGRVNEDLNILNNIINYLKEYED